MTKARRRPASLALLALCGGLLGLAAPAAAQGYYDQEPRGPGPGYGHGPGPGYGYRPDEIPELDRWQRRAEAWLTAGMRNGTLTPREADRIRWALDDLRRHEWAARRDGVVTPYEREALREQAERIEAMMQREMHDRQAMPPMPYGSPYGPGRSW